MLIGKVMEQTPAVSASENMANRLADRIRNLWLGHVNAGDKEWEENFYEDPEGIAFLREESFPCLQGIDYIFKWWNHDDSEGLAGQLEVLWKVRRNGEMKIYKTTIRMANRDFIVGTLQSERDKREWMRGEFRTAFAEWQKLFQAVLSRPV